MRQKYTKKITKGELAPLISKNIYDTLNEEQYAIEIVNPISLLTFNRFDLLAKYIYVKFKIANIKSSFGEKLYLRHIGLLNGFFEDDQSGKVGKSAFLDAFNQLIESIEKYGFDHSVSILPLAVDGSLLDGSHRAAVALALGCRVAVIRTRLNPHKFDYKYFMQRGLSEIYLNAMALEFVHLKEQAKIIIIWPSAKGRLDELRSIINRYSEVIYERSLHLTQSGSVQLILQTYGSETWIGTKKNDFAGARNKAAWCFNGNNSLRFFVIESCSDTIALKNDIRKLFKIGKHSVHIGDTHAEMYNIAGHLMNANSIHWLNHSFIVKFSWSDKLLAHYKSWLVETAKNTFNYCIDGSMTLAIYGAREARDLDFLTKDTEGVLTGFKEIDCHNDQISYHSLNRDEIIFDPRNHLVVNGIKFTSLNNIELMKRARNEGKDVEDVELINSIKAGKPVKKYCVNKIKILFQPSFWAAKLKILLLKLRYNFLLLIK